MYYVWCGARSIHVRVDRTHIHRNAITAKLAQKGTAYLRIDLSAICRGEAVVMADGTAGVLVGTLQRYTEGISNPLEPQVASAWNYMTDNYDKFTITTWFSIVLHEVATARNFDIMNVFISSVVIRGFRYVLVHLIEHSDTNG